MVRLGPNFGPGPTTGGPAWPNLALSRPDLCLSEARLGPDRAQIRQHRPELAKCLSKNGQRWPDNGICVAQIGAALPQAGQRSPQLGKFGGIRSNGVRGHLVGSSLCCFPELLPNTIISSSSVDYMCHMSLFAYLAFALCMVILLLHIAMMTVMMSVITSICLVLDLLSFVLLRP